MSDDAVTCDDGSQTDPNERETAVDADYHLDENRREIREADRRLRQWSALPVRRAEIADFGITAVVTKFASSAVFDRIHLVAATFDTMAVKC